MARHLDTDTDTPLINFREIIIPSYNFSDKIHNEDFHYTRLIAGFVQDSENLRILIFTYDPKLEPLIFSDLFTNRRGHFHDIVSQSSQGTTKTREETYGKYIKLRLLNIDSRWRCH